MKKWEFEYKVNIGTIVQTVVCAAILGIFSLAFNVQVTLSDMKGEIKSIAQSVIGLNNQVSQTIRVYNDHEVRLRVLEKRK